MRLTTLALTLAVSALATGCGGSGGNSSSTNTAESNAISTPDPNAPDPRFELAKKVTDGWCMDAFRTTSGFNANTIGDTEIFNDLYTELTQFSGAKSIVDAELQPPVELRALKTQWCEPELPAPADLTENIYCKMPSQARVADVMGRTPDAAPGTCRERNQAAFAWAWAQLSDEEQRAYTSTGRSVAFLEDQIVERGGDWLPLTPHFEPDGDGNYTFASPSLLSDYIPSDNNETLDGVHYCTLVTPEQALYWLLHRGLKEEPGKCVSEDACLEPSVVPEGSCVFYFVATYTHMCEEYRGPYWDQALSEAKCADRGGAYSTAPCFEREEEVALLDSDDSGFIGTCDIACGQEERIWYMFSTPPNTDPSNEACFTAAEGHPLLR